MLFLASAALIQIFSKVYHRFPELLGRRIFCLELGPSPLNLDSMAPLGKELFLSPKHLIPRLLVSQSDLNGNSRLRMLFKKTRKAFIFYCFSRYNPVFNRSSECLWKCCSCHNPANSDCSAKLFNTHCNTWCRGVTTPWIAHVSQRAMIFPRLWIQSFLGI